MKLRLKLEHTEQHPPTWPVAEAASRSSLHNSLCLKAPDLGLHVRKGQVGAATLRAQVKSFDGCAGHLVISQRLAQPGPLTWTHLDAGPFPFPPFSSPDYSVHCRQSCHLLCKTGPAVPLVLPEYCSHYAVKYWDDWPGEQDSPSCLEFEGILPRPRP